MKLVLIGVVLLIVIGGVWYISSNNQEAEVPGEVSAPSPTPTPTPTPAPTPPPAAENVITITSSGFSPSTITIKKGQTITFRSESSQPSWPASAIHPTHMVYPGSNIAKCDTPGQDEIFDACTGLARGEEWSFTFDSTGSWKYHDHLNPSRNGTIIVE